MKAKYLEIPVNTVVASGALGLVVNASTSAGIASGSNAAVAVSGELNDSTATFVTDGVVVGDTVYNVNANTQGACTAVTETKLTFASNLFNAGSEAYAVRKVNQLNMAVGVFTTRKVRVGDIVSNTTAGTATTVAALINETSLTLTADIFNSPTLFNDSFTISAPATEAYEFDETFLTKVNVGDVYENTTQNFSGVVVSVLDNFRFRCGSTVGAIGDNFNVFDTTVASSYLIQMDQIVLAQRLDAERTTIQLNTVANSTITIDHSDQGTGRAVAIAIQEAMKRGYIGVDMPEPPGPSTARVQMPIFNDVLITVESVAAA